MEGLHVAPHALRGERKAFRESRSSLPSELERSVVDVPLVQEFRCLRQQAVRKVDTMTLELIPHNGRLLHSATPLSEDAFHAIGVDLVYCARPWFEFLTQTW